MEIIEKIGKMQERAEQLRISGETISFVPTMGFFHEGHLELMRVGKNTGSKLVISIFVNPIQFGPSEDFERYPRDLEGDLKKAEDVGVDIVFIPSVEEMYPEGFQTKVSVRDLTQHLCGLSRPGHFDGVTTVVAKLFNIVKPHIAIFGQKDYQQLTVISRMVMDLNMDIKIVGVPTVREPDGLAMSSRNTYLKEEERESALSLVRSLELAQNLLNKGEDDPGKIKEEIERFIRKHPYTEIDYVSVCDPDTLEELKTIPDRALVALAVKVGSARLIDNRIITKKIMR